VGVHSLTFSYIPGSMKCDFQVSFLAHTFTSPCLGHKAKVRVATIFMINCMPFNLIDKTPIVQCFLCNFQYCFCETNLNPKHWFSNVLCFVVNLFQKTPINKHSIFDNNVNHSFIFNLVHEVVLLLSHDQMNHIHNDVNG